MTPVPPKPWDSFFIRGPSVSPDFFPELPRAGQELPAEVNVTLRQHIDHDDGGQLRSWVEVTEPPAPRPEPRTLVDIALAGSHRSRRVSDEVQGPPALDQLLEQAFQNILGVWPHPRRGLRHDLDALGYTLNWTELDEMTTITPVCLTAKGFNQLKTKRRLTP